MGVEMREFTQDEIDSWLEANAEGVEYNLAGVIVIDMTTQEHLEFGGLPSGIELGEYYKSLTPVYLEKYGERTFGHKFIQHSKYVSSLEIKIDSREDIQKIGDLIKEKSPEKVVTNIQIATVLSFDIPGVRTVHVDINNPLSVSEDIYLMGYLNETEIYVDPNMSFLDNRLIFKTKNDTTVYKILTDINLI